MATLTPTSTPTPTPTSAPTPTPAPPPESDFGDAPDGGDAGYPIAVAAKFPSLLASDGAHIRNPGQDVLGEEITTELDANLVDADGADDGLLDITVVLLSIPPPAALAVSVTTAPDAPAGPRFLNVLIDLNMNGEWGGATAGGELEWVVRNFSQDVAPGTTVNFVPPAFAFAFGHGNRLPFGAWMRVALTREPIDAGDWDGTGTFEFGEIEDYKLVLPDAPGGDGNGNGGGGDGKGRTAAPVMVCPPKVSFGGLFITGFRCSVTNLGAKGDISWNLTRQTGGVVVLVTDGQIIGLGTGATEKIGYLALDLGTPSQWRYTADVIDPPFGPNDDGSFDYGVVPGDNPEPFDNIGPPACPECVFSDPAGDGFLSEPTWEVEPRARTDIIGGGIFVSDAPALADWFNNEGPLPCGAEGFAGPGSVVVCSHDPLPFPGGPVLIGNMQVAAPPLIGAPADLFIEYSLVADGDGVAENNWTPFGPFTNDTFQGTDAWYQANREPGTGRWELFTNDISSGDFNEFPTAARVVIAGDNVTFFVPVDEFTNLGGVRLVTFGFDINLPIDGSGSVDTSGVTGPDFGPDSLIVPPDGPPIFIDPPAADTVVERISPALSAPGATFDIELVALSLRGPSPIALPVVGDFDGDGTDDVAIFDQGMFVVFDPAQPGDAFPVTPGQVFDVPNMPPDALPTAGDTNGNGRDELGVFSPSSGDWQFFEVDASGGLMLIDEFGPFGGPNDLPFLVDFDGDGVAEPGTYDPGAGLLIVGERTPSGVDPIFSAKIAALLAELGSPSTVDLGADGGQALVFRDDLGDWSLFDFESDAAVSIPSEGFTRVGAHGVAGDFDGDGLPERLEMIFEDGFESGDTSAWSSTVP